MKEEIPFLKEAVPVNVGVRRWSACTIRKFPSHNTVFLRQGLALSRFENFANRGATRFLFPRWENATEKRKVWKTKVCVFVGDVRIGKKSQCPIGLDGFRQKPKMLLTNCMLIIKLLHAIAIIEQTRMLKRKHVILSSASAICRLRLTYEILIYRNLWSICICILLPPIPLLPPPTLLLFSLS